MDTVKESPQVWPVWVNWEERIISFREVEAYEKLEYATHDELFRFAMEKAMEGFAIQ